MLSPDLLAVDDDKSIVKKARQTLREIVHMKALEVPESDESEEEDDEALSRETHNFEVLQEQITEAIPEEEETKDLQKSDNSPYDMEDRGGKSHE